jgi:hypothetical protein
VRVDGEFALNEFARLSVDDLQFLRLFVHLEGRIRDMESALGVSYPTIKARIAALKRTLFDQASPVSDEARAALADAPADDDGVQRILEQLEQGTISPTLAKELLRKREDPAP